MNPVQIESRISSLEASVQALSGELKVARKVYFWREVDTVLPRSLDEIKESVTDITQQCRGLYDSLESINDRNKLVAAAKRIVRVERVCLRLECSCLFHIDADQFLTAYREIQERVNQITEAHDDEAKERILQEIQDNQLLEPAQEILNVCRMAQMEGVDALLAATQGLARLKPELLAIEAGGDELLQGFTQADHEFQFWKHVAFSPWVSSYLGWYRETGPLGTEIEDEIGKKICGLQKAYETLVDELCLADTDSVPAAYKPAIAKLYEQVNARRDEVYTKDLDRLTDVLLAYVNGLEMFLGELQRQHALAEFLATDQAQGILKAQKALWTYLLAREGSTGEAVEAFQVGRHLQALSGNVPLEESFVTSQHALVKNIFSAQVTSTVTIQESEQAAWDAVIKSDLPDFDRLLSCLVRGITKALFSGDEPVLDSSVELLLYAARQDNRLQHADQQTMGIIGEYDASFAEGRNDVHLEEARRVRCLIFKAQEEETIFSYAEALHYLVAFSQNAHTNPRHMGLSKLLFANLDQLGHPVLFQRLRTKALGDLVTEHNEMHTLLTELAIAKNDDKFYPGENRDLRATKALEGFFVRSLACWLHGGEEQDAAHKHVQNILEKQWFKEYLPHFSDATKELLFAYTKQKAVLGIHEFAQQEISWFIQGPVEAFLASPWHKPEDASLKHAIYALIMHGNEPVKEFFTSRKGQEALEEFCRSYHSFLAAGERQPYSKYEDDMLAVHRTRKDALASE